MQRKYLFSQLLLKSTIFRCEIRVGGYATPRGVRALARSYQFSCAGRTCGNYLPCNRMRTPTSSPVSDFPAGAAPLRAFLRVLPLSLVLVPLLLMPSLSLQLRCAQLTSRCAAIYGPFGPSTDLTNFPQRAREQFLGRVIRLQSIKYLLINPIGKYIG